MTTYPLQPLDTLGVCITGGCIATGAFSVFLLVRLLGGRQSGPRRKILGWMIALSVAAPLILAFAWSPRHLCLTPGQLILVSPLSREAIPLAEIQEVRMATSEDVEGAWRTFGVGGLFGYYGEFRSSKLGRYRMFSTARRGNVLIRTGQGCLVTSPAQPEAFISVLQSSRGSAEP